MLDEMFTKGERRKAKDLNIVPILDMMTTVIFFLLLSTSFVEFTKITIPPSRVSTITAPEKPPPAQPKLMVMEVKDGIRLQIVWSGDKPGIKFELYKPQTIADPDEKFKADSAEIQKLAKKLSEQYKQEYPNEKALQIGMGSKVPYQYLISVMDGVRDAIPDLVLISHREVDAETSRSGLGD